MKGAKFQVTELEEYVCSGLQFFLIECTMANILQRYLTQFFDNFVIESLLDPLFHKVMWRRIRYRYTHSQAGLLSDYQ